jgi:hypothetical protein
MWPLGHVGHVPYSFINYLLFISAGIFDEKLRPHILSKCRFKGNTYRNWQENNLNPENCIEFLYALIINKWIYWTKISKKINKYIFVISYICLSLQKNIIFNKTERFVWMNTSDHACQIFCFIIYLVLNKGNLHI